MKKIFLNAMTLSLLAFGGAGEAAAQAGNGVTGFATYCDLGTNGVTGGGAVCHHPRQRPDRLRH